MNLIELRLLRGAAKRKGLITLLRQSIDSLLRVVAVVAAVACMVSLYDHALRNSQTPPNPLYTSNKVLMNAGPRVSITGVNSEQVLDWRQADALMGTEFKHVRTTAIGKTRTTIYYNGESFDQAVRLQQPTFQVSALYEHNKLGKSSYDASRIAARATKRWSFTDLNTMTYWQLNGASRAFMQLQADGRGINSITFTTPTHVTVLIAIQGATQDKLLEAARVAIMNLGSQNYNVIEV